jgi:putative MATE family efflux protein
MTTLEQTGADMRPARPAKNPRTLRLLNGPIAMTLLAMAWPNVLVMLAQASTGLIETWWVSHLGTDALAGLALVFPCVMLMQMVSGGAMGGGISSAIARALGASRHEEANALVWHALVANVVIGLCFSTIMLLWGEPIYRALGGRGGELQAALKYSNVVFAGNIMLWAMNAFASVIRGTGNMLVPALAICGGVVILVPLSPLLIFGWGPIPAMGVSGGGAALLAYYAVTGIALGYYILSGRNVVHLRVCKLQWRLFRDILRVGAVAAVTSVQTNVTIALATAMVAATAGTAAVAGFGTGARLEYLLIPLAFGMGGPLVPMVGTNIGAGQKARALRIALVGGALSFALTEFVGLVAAIWPQAWLSLFTTDPSAIETGAAYLRIVGPAYGFFGLGMALYFASQGAGKLFWPLSAGFIRLTIAVVGGWLLLRATGSLHWLYAAIALGLFAFGTTLTIAVKSGVWLKDAPEAGTGRK